MAPIVTPATRTDWPWPGCTAWALDSTASIFFGDSSSSGKRSRWLDRMYAPTPSPSSITAATARNDGR